MSVGACAAPTYIDPQVEAADYTEIAIVKNRLFGCPFCIDRITRMDGKSIPVHSSESYPIAEFEEFRLSPGEYRISYSYKHRKIPRVSDTNVVNLKAGHVYAVKSQSCIWFCFRMKWYSADIWLEDISTGELIGGCRQGMGCAGVAPTMRICAIAITIKDETATWDRRPASRKYVKEAKRRNLTPNQCAELLGR